MREFTAGALSEEPVATYIEDAGSAGWVPSNTAIQLGGQDAHVVVGPDVLNSYCSYYTTNGAMTLVFNRLLDPELVASVTVDGPDGTTLTFSR